MIAIDALTNACQTVRKEPLHTTLARWPTIPGTFVQMNAIELATLLPTALEIVRGYGNRNAIRDNAIVSILEAFRNLHGSWPSAKVASRLIFDIQLCYAELLPKYGFNVNADGTIYRLLDRAEGAADRSTVLFPPV